MLNLATASLTSVTAINSGAFKNDTSLTSVSLSTSLITLPAEACVAFYKMTGFDFKFGGSDLFHDDFRKNYNLFIFDLEEE